MLLIHLKFYLMKKYLYLLFFGVIFTFISCSSSDDHTETISVASSRATYYDPELGKQEPCFLIKKKSNESWDGSIIIDNFTYEPGFEYTLKVQPTGFRTEYQGYVCLKVLSKVQKKSDNLPSNLWDK
jgi:hypothetical protein